MILFYVVRKGQNHNCYLNELGEVWIIEADGSKTSSSRFLVDINTIIVAEKAAIEILMMSGR